MEYVEWCVETLDGRRFPAIAVDGSNQHIYDLRRAQHNTFVVAWQRCWGMFDRNCAVLLSAVPSSDMLFLGYEMEGSYCQNLRNLTTNVGTTEILAKMNLV